VVSRSLVSSLSKITSSPIRQSSDRPRGARGDGSTRQIAYTQRLDPTGLSTLLSGQKTTIASAMPANLKDDHIVQDLSLGYGCPMESVRAAQMFRQLRKATASASNFEGDTRTVRKKYTSTHSPTTCSRVIRATTFGTGVFRRSSGRIRANRSRVRAISPVHPV